MDGWPGIDPIERLTLTRGRATALEAEAARARSLAPARRRPASGPGGARVGPVRGAVGGWLIRLGRAVVGERPDGVAARPDRVAFRLER